MACELCYRTIDRFVVTRSWAARWAAASGPARADLAQRVALWDEIVDGWYVMLLTAHVIGLATFAGAFGWRGGRRDRFAAAALAAYALVTAMRLCANAVAALEPICAALYFPTALASFAAIGAALRRPAG